jgi:hypothetical protein
LRAAGDEKAPLTIQLIFQLFFGFWIRRITCCNSFVLPETIIISATATAAVVVTLTVIGIHNSYPSRRLRPTTTFM